MSEILKQLSTGITSQSVEETESIGAALADCLPQDHVLALHGELGAGKTTLVRGLARAWGIKEPVTSPTFNLYTLYEGERKLMHLDAYRLQSGADLDALMLEEFLESPWCLAVEWPERIPESIPPEAWHLDLASSREGQHTLRLRMP
ncbi:MAG: tRNA threonylcarbamoyladenosine biosynthesis protein TsaE [Opitutia bacterium UBA7350]|nr:MAG: tRNA threonylcarbamoyladenosine biosynthesis protein TsaE [Opitutae bacterium UBA7350]